MAIQDSNAELRNLSVLSIVIILFYLGEGKLTDANIRFQVVNIQFEKPEVLSYFIWILLLWFALRYWQTHRYKPKESYINDIESLSNSILLRWYAKREYGLAYNKINGFNAVSLSILDTKWSIRCQIVYDADFDKQGKFKVIRKTGWSEFKEIIGIKGYLLKILLKINAAITKPGISAYTVPYLLFFMALLMPYIKILKEIF